MLLAVGRVGIEAAGLRIDAHESGSQLAYRKTLSGRGSGYRGISLRP